MAELSLEPLFEPIAIVGMAGRFPGAADVDELWRNLCAGHVAISRFTAEEVIKAGVPADVAADPHYVPARGVIDGIELFDAEFFGYTPAEAEMMDPQQRLFLECAWMACEDAGYAPRTYPGRIGVYGGAAFSSYLIHHLLGHTERLEAMGSLTARLLNDKDFLTTHVSYKLNLRGPSVAVQTACSTSLVAVHLACQALLEGECEMALAGGVAAGFPHRAGYLYQEGGIVSPDGRCRSFDSRAQGTVEGSGAGAVLLKRLADALAEGDVVHAVVRGSAVNNDGAGKVGFTAPGSEGQTQVVGGALAIAGVSADSIGYVEAHGSATALGDPVEVASLTRAFRASTARRNFCALGSIKANVGHADNAAGIASLIKVVQALRHRRIPPSPDFGEPNPRLDLDASPFYIARQAADWPAGPEPRRAGVSSLGIGGTNAHLVLEEAPAAAGQAGGAAAPGKPAERPSRPWQLIALSARTASELARAAGRLADRLAPSGGDGGRDGAEGAGGDSCCRGDGGIGLDGDGDGALADAQIFADAAHTLRVGRQAFRHRAALVCRDATQARQQLARLAGRGAALVEGGAAGAAGAPAGGIGGVAAEDGAAVAFLLPGLGDQLTGMGAQLYREEPAFRAAIDRAAELLRPQLDSDLREVLFGGAVAAGAPSPGERAAADDERMDAGAPAADGEALKAGLDLRRMLAPAVDEAEAARPIQRTLYAHPAVFALEYALAQLWSEWGVRPAALIGYSLGEMAAACLAGVFSLADGLSLVAARARLIEALPGGAMLAVPLAAAEVAPLLAAAPELSLAADNGAAMAVVGGPAPAVKDFARLLAERGVACRQLETRHAFHTRAMQPIVEQLTRLASSIHLAPPRVPVVSNVTGTWLTAGEATDPAYWARHLCEPVRFAEGLDTLFAAAPQLLLEVGPGQTLGTLARQHPRRPAGQQVLAALPGRASRHDEQQAMLEALGRLWVAGATPDWGGFAAHERRRRVSLPTYPWTRRPYLVERRDPRAAAITTAAAAAAAAQADALARRPPADWLHAPTWERAPQEPAPDLGGRWLLLTDRGGAGDRLAALLESRGAQVVRVAAHLAPAAGAGTVVGSPAATAGGDGQSRPAAQTVRRAIDPRRPEDWRALLAELAAAGTPPRHVVHLANLGAAAGEVEDTGFHSLLHLAQALGTADLPRPLHVAVVTDGLHAVLGDEPVWPLKATLLGPCRVLPQELDGVTCSVLDVVLPAGAPSAAWLGRLAADPALAGPPPARSPAESVRPGPSSGDSPPAPAPAAPTLLGSPEAAAAGAAPPEPSVALRGAHRWLPRYRRVAVPAPRGPLPRRLRREGVYLIAGGLSGAAVAIAERLFAGAGARLALLVGPDEPAREQWERWLSAHDDDDALSRRLRRLIDLERRGCRLQVLSADPVQAAHVAAAVAAVRARFGALHGVLMAAPEPGAGLLAWLTRKQAVAALAPFVGGVAALAAAVAGQPLDLFVLCGTSAALTGGFGSTVATAAAAFVDAFAHAASAAAAGTGSAAGEPPALPVVQAIDWGLFAWQPVTAPGDAAAAVLRTGVERYGIAAGDLGDTLMRVLDAPLPQVAVVTQDLAALTAQVAALRSTLLPAALGGGAGAGRFSEGVEGVEGADGAQGARAAHGAHAGHARHARADLATPYEAPATDLEQAIAAVWQDAFGIDQVGVHDNFFDLAGNSLLAIQIVTRLSQSLGIDLAMSTLLEGPTVAELARHAASLLPAGFAASAGAAAPALDPTSTAAPESALAAAAAPVPAVVRHAPREWYPLSFDQERLWFNQQLDLASPAYNIYNASRYKGPLDMAAMAGALNEVVRRHDVLRTTFHQGDGHPVQRVAPRLTVSIPHVDLRALPPGRREAEARRWADAMARAPFALDRLPLFRTLLLQVGDAERILPICIHHIVTDWVSYYIFEHELTLVYRALREGQPPLLPELPVQFTDFAIWQRERLGDPRRIEQLMDYWREQLADAPDLLPLPTDRPRPAVATPWGARRSLVLSERHSEGLRALAQGEGMTLFIAGAAVFKFLLMRLSGQEKLILGSPIAYRNAPELQNVLGFFINQLVLYTDLTGNPPARQAMHRVRDVALAAYSHQEMPFAKLIDTLRPHRDLSRVPFTQFVFLLLKPTQLEHSDLPELEITGYWLDAQRTQFDMTFSLWDDEVGLRGWMEHNTDLYDGVTIDRMKDQYRVLLDGLLADPERPLWDLPLLPAAQRHQLLVEWPGGDRAPRPAAPAAAPIDRQIAARAAAAPDAVAVVCGDRSMTYGALARRAGDLAARLRRLGVGPEVPVGLCCGRTTDLVPGLLGILAAGGAFLPLDPGHPDARLALLIENGLAGPLDRPAAAAAAAVIVAAPDQHQRLRRAAGSRPLHLVPLGALPTPPAAPGGEAAGTAPGEARAAAAMQQAAASPAAGSQAAYLLFTSGTTGVPKGVVVEHASLASFLGAAQERFAFVPGDRVACLAPFSFDIALFELLAPLAAGATQVVFELAPALDLAGLLRELPALTTLHAVPALMRELATAAAEAPRRNLRHVLCGGDRVSDGLIAAMRTAFPAARLYVSYGPTEATIFATLEEAAAVADTAGTLPDSLGSRLGRPFGEATVVLQQRPGRAAAIGATGEVWIGGPVLARGYLRQPELTAERFALLDGRRHFRTGDLARQRPDGRLEFLGRADQQVKVRGVRIELGEVEAAIAALPGVQEAVVTVRTAGEGGGVGESGARAAGDRGRQDGGAKRLAAYVVLHPTPAPPSAAELRRALAQLLPEAMVPASWTLLAELPRNSHGKVDRAALPAPAESTGVAAGDGSGDGGTPPRHRLERQLAEVWCEVLGRPGVGIDESFFALGGDSILSIQVVVRARRLGIDLTPRQIFQHPTIAELAAVAGSAAHAVAEQGPVVGPVPLTPVQRLFFAAAAPAPHHDNQALLLELDAAPAAGRLAAALAALTRHHDALRLRFHRAAGGSWEQVSVAPAEAPAPVTVVDLSALPSAAVAASVPAAVAAAQASLDLARGPLQRLALFERGAGAPPLLLWAIHHLVVDAVSWRILLEDLAALCAVDLPASAETSAVPATLASAADALAALLPPKTSSFRAWAERLAAHAGSLEQAAELGYWRQLAWEAAMPLPRDAGAGSGAAAAAGTMADERLESLALSPGETEALLLDLPRTAGTQIHETLLAALALACRDWSGGALLVDVEGHGREELFADLDLTRTAGWFTSVAPVVLDLGEAAGARAALAAVRDRLRAVPRGGIGWGLLRWLSPAAAELAALPAAEVSFNYLGRLDQALPPGSPYRPAPWPAAGERSPLAPRRHLLAVTGAVIEGCLHVTCAYSARHHRQAAIASLLAGCARHLRELAADAGVPGETPYTPADFPLAGLDQAKLDRLLAGRKAAAP